jgi:gas vesicle protein
MMNRPASYGQFVQQRPDENSGGFLAGLMFGAMAGIAGMFLFTTKKGQKTVMRVKKIWEKIEPQVETELTKAGHKLDKSKKPLLQGLGEIVEYVVEKLDKPTKGKRGK